MGLMSNFEVCMRAVFHSGSFHSGSKVISALVFASFLSACGDSSNTDSASAGEMAQSTVANKAMSEASVVEISASDASAADVSVAEVLAASKGPSGEETYNKFCITCHASGLSGAPKMGNAEDWAPRTAKGLDALVASTIEGVPPAMPAKGLCFNCSDDQLRDTVAWMIEQQ